MIYLTQIFVLFFCATAIGKTNHSERRKIEREDRLSITTPHFRARFQDEIPTFCRTFELACGWELLPSEVRWKPKMNDLSISTPVTGHDLLDLIRKRHPQYQFAFEDGVLNILPSRASAESDRYQSPLDSMIGDLEMNHVSLQEAAMKIGLAANMAHSKWGLPINGTPIEFRTISVQVQHSSARQALNKTVRTDGSSMWIFFPNLAEAESRISAAWRAFKKMLPLSPSASSETWVVEGIRIYQWPTQQLGYDWK